ncbi:inositol monophosphatase family protein [Salipiger thiooxidans]|uniref:inositol monophosphatase family protein n=1 Tax=Salipiger thiooxidans TaxID=282683 RepID=UPI003BF56114
MKDQIDMVTTAEAEVLVALLRKVGREIVLPRFRNLDPAEIDAKTEPTDLVTIADQEAEVALAAGARAIFPGCEVVGEEAVSDDPALLDRIAGAETCVIIDPVGGTFNFTRGLAVFGIILAVTRHGETVPGLLYDPVTDDWVIAPRGAGAEYVSGNGARRRLSVRGPVALSEAEGTVPLDLYRPERWAEILRAFDGTRSARSPRCSCHEYRMLAMGLADFSANASLKPWDHAAGALVLEDAGGSAVVEGGRRYAPTLRKGRIVAAGFGRTPPGIRSKMAESNSASNPRIRRFSVEAGRFMSSAALRIEPDRATS